MKWFKHDSSASLDSKLKLVRLKYKMEGYGLYWYCLELIAADAEKHNLTFELEHDAELISSDTGINQDRVQQMMVDFVKWGIFEQCCGVIDCLKMSIKTDQHTHKSIEILQTMGTLCGDCPDKVPPNRIEEKEKTVVNPDGAASEETLLPKKQRINTPYSEIVDLYHEKLPMMPGVEKLTEVRKRYIRNLWADDLDDLINWSNFFDYVAKSEFLTGRTQNQNAHKNWTANLEWITKPANFLKILEKQYHGKI